MNYINTYIVNKFDVSNFKIKVPKFYDIIKNETKLAYLLLNYAYYKKYSKFLNTDNIYKDKNGKPIFINNTLYFNISHSKKYVACCISSINVGIDIEEERIIKYNSLNKILHKDDKNIYYTNVWNIKEAYSKYLGIGLKLNFSNISISEIKQKVILFNKIYNFHNKNLYISLCYNKDIYFLNKDITFLKKNNLINFYIKELFLK